MSVYVSVCLSVRLSVYMFSMGVTAEMLRPFLEGWTLKQIIDAKRLFIVNMKILEKIPTRYNRPVNQSTTSGKVVYHVQYTSLPCPTVNISVYG